MEQILHIGKVNKYLTIIGDSGKRAGRKVIWKVQCICGKQLEQRYERFLRNRSCGCKKACDIGKNSPHWTGYKDISGDFWNTLQYSAKKRKLEISITKEYAWEILEKQNFCCKLSGRKLEFRGSYKKGQLGYKIGNASIDRIDSSKGYIEGNIQWVDKDVNRAKSYLTDEEFIQLCQEVVSTKSLDKSNKRSILTT